MSAGFDCDRHVGVAGYEDLFPHMSLSWRKHFERDEFFWGIRDATAHTWVDERFNHDPVVGAADTDGEPHLAIPHQALTINGWVDQVAAKTFLHAVNDYGGEHWNGPSTRRAAVVSPVDPAWSAAEVRRAAAAGAAAIALPLTSTLLGSEHFDPIYDACAETGLPIVVTFSGVEGKYLGAAPLPGGVHYSNFSRAVLMPQLAESCVTSLAFEGTFEKFPGLQVLFAGFGFHWMPSLLWRMDREWRTFRHDVPWVKETPSTYVLEHIWLSTWPLGELSGPDAWERFGFTDALADRIVFGSHQPFGGDPPADVVATLGEERGAAILLRGASLLAPLSRTVN
jgi:predicted TIM-barrel fold metal-dependent hydrolase